MSKIEDIVRVALIFRRHSIGGYTMDFVTPEDRAATKIQAEIRGFLARRKVSAMRKENADAATKIQAHIRYGNETELGYHKNYSLDIGRLRLKPKHWLSRCEKSTTL
jgi:hypothetical protein